MYEGDENNFDAAPPEETSNRTFLIAAGILGAIVLLSLACIAGYVLVILPQQQASQLQASNAQGTQAAQIGQALTATFQAQIMPTATLPPTQTPVVAQASATSVPATATTDPSTATVAAALTQAMVAQLTVVPTSSALPGTGISDEFGFPGLIVMAIALVIIILLARRLRRAPASNR
jgi:cell division septation protein DedD